MRRFSFLLAFILIVLAAALYWRLTQKHDDKKTPEKNSDASREKSIALIEGSGWTLCATGLSVDLADVFFTSAAVGYIVGPGELIVRTRDGGETFEIVRRGEEKAADLKQVIFSDEARGWVKGRDVLLRTLDGGQNWIPVVRPTTYYFGPSCADGSLYFQMDAPTYSTTIFLTEDGGRHWSKFGAPLPKNDYECVFFLDRRFGWVGKKGGEIARTEDGGQTWIVSEIPGGPRLLKIQFINAKKGWAMPYAKHDGGILTSDDGGVSWKRQDVKVPANQNIVDMRFLDEQVGFVAANADKSYSRIYRTRDGGHTWHEIAFVKKRVRAISFVAHNLGWAVGEDGFAARFSEK